MASPKVHFATCWYCRAAANLLQPTSAAAGGSARLKCGNCKYFCQSIGRRWLCYPCGWWEPHPGICQCVYLDRLGFKLGKGEYFLFAPCANPRDYKNGMFLICNVKGLRMDFIYGEGRVCFAGRYGLRMSLQVYDSFIHGSLHVADIISTKAFDRLRGCMAYAVTNLLPKLRRIRQKLWVVNFLRCIEIMRLCRTDRTINRLILMASSPVQVSDHVDVARSLYLAFN